MNKKEAIEIIKKNWPDSRYTMLREALQTLIPELKESVDERIKRCIEMCLTDATEQRFEDFNTTLKDCLVWLEKQGEQKLAEWSEEDKEIIESIIEDLERSKKKYIGLTGEYSYNVQINWLKSLTPQNHWKPTEEQLNAIKIADNLYYTGHSSEWEDNQHKQLKSLYNDLKKL